MALRRAWRPVAGLSSEHGAGDCEQAVRDRGFPVGGGGYVHPQGRVQKRRPGHRISCGNRLTVMTGTSSSSVSMNAARPSGPNASGGVELHAFDLCPVSLHDTVDHRRDLRGRIRVKRRDLPAALLFEAARALLALHPLRHSTTGLILLSHNKMRVRKDAYRGMSGGGDAVVDGRLPVGVSPAQSLGSHGGWFARESESIPGGGMCS